MPSTPTTVRASTVSAALRRGGVLPSPSARRYKHEGVFVSRSALNTEVHVAIDIEHGAARAALGDLATGILIGAGYAVREVTHHGYLALYVTRPTS